MNASFYDLDWKKGEPSYIEQGVKGHKRPKGAVYGGNGSFRVVGDPPALYLTVKRDDGMLYCVDVYNRVMEETGRKRMSEKFYAKIYKKFENATFTIDDNHIKWSCNL